VGVPRNLSHNRQDSSVTTVIRLWNGKQNGSSESVQNTLSLKMLLNYFKINLVRCTEKDCLLERDQTSSRAHPVSYSMVTEGSWNGKKGYRSVKLTILFHLVQHENTWRCVSLQHMLKQKNYTCASYYKIKITRLFSSPLVTYRPINLIFQFGEIPLTRNTRLTHERRDTAHETEERWLEGPCDKEEEFSSNN
jgi:hypothetical protein